MYFNKVIFVQCKSEARPLNSSLVFASNDTLGIDCEILYGNKSPPPMPNLSHISPAHAPIPLLENPF
jgi:hypothetical protein